MPFVHIFSSNSPARDPWPGHPVAGCALILSILLWAFATVMISFRYVGPKFLLIWNYGWTKVSAEELHFLRMPKGKPWAVSNGDSIDMVFGNEFYCAICGFVLMMSMWLLFHYAYYVWSVRKTKPNEQGTDKSKGTD